ncbi:PSD1 and planctomycete cytochrome C domain-containing protein [Stieleria varia]|uniref:Planctomycete cytochrome C n=1 Tax=Stieleria varia TaxID=2528005 RepID=A0A5C6B214_9BACT|nr:PSD1 and planctomycete cytochrome C domain-containing protein [Stieleria varia]TWU06355.1 Planctomycete cytochrome C [Stieleria varia]
MMRCVALLPGLVIAIAASVVAGEIDFHRDVQPLLRRHCDRCHGASQQEGGLTLADAQGLLGVAESDETIVVPGQPDQSLLIARLTDSDFGDRMPLDGEPLTKSEVQVLRSWIHQGADVPKDWGTTGHWAYETPQRPDVPATDSNWTRNPIDQFVLSRLGQAGLSPSPDASPETLARRVSLALTGLPATPEQLRDLADDPSDENYEALVDELLGSPAFGQHWARHWLDLARYADSNGFQADQLRDAWAYRDWVVDAFANDMPFDEFVTQQIAGDLLPDANASTRIATGFHRTPTCNVEAGVHPEANRVEQVFDRVNTTATVFLGSTIECAQCHDHKYDPFTQQDYYRLFAYFNNTPLEVEKQSGVQFDFVGPKMDLPLASEQESELVSLRQQLTELKKQHDSINTDEQFRQWQQSTRQALASGRAEWITPRPSFTSSGDEAAEILDDQSVLISGGLPGSTVYRFEYANVAQPVIGIRLEALRHDDLPGGGPGRGDAERTNFVLHELELNVQTAEDLRSVELGSATASFSQPKYEVANAVDGKTGTGWAIAPQFKKEHWAEFHTIDPVAPDPDARLVITLDQRFGRGRVIGRPRISLLVGSPETADLPDQIAQYLMSEGPLKPGELKKLRAHFDGQNPAVQQLQRRITATENAIDKMAPPTTLVMVEEPEPRETFVMLRGDYLSPGDPVSPGTPASLHPLDDDMPANRLGLARWLVDRDNPLLARVTVNRLWAQVFGRGIVVTEEDFGTQSEPPSHPQLLDFLALELQDEWSIKQVLKTIVLSSTFRQSSSMTSQQLQQDPDNVWLSRGPRYRLPAETIRDNALAISGLLSLQSGGPPIMPYQPDGIWRAVGRNQPTWKAADDADRYRRGLYVVWKRSAPYPSFVTFDAPDRASCTVKRPRTNTPLQALVLLNDHAYAEAAVALAQRVLRETDTDNVDDIARYAFSLATGRWANDQQVRVLVGLYRTERQRLTEQPDEVKQRLSVLPKTFRDEQFDAIEVAAWYSVASALLNLDETITLN